MDAHTICDNCKYKWSCSYYTERDDSNKDYFEWEIQAKKCSEVRMNGRNSYE